MCDLRAIVYEHGWTFPCLLSMDGLPAAADQRHIHSIKKPMVVQYILRGGGGVGFTVCQVDIAR